MTTSVQHAVSCIPTQLHLPGQRQQSIPRETHHMISIQKHHAGSNVVMCGHVQDTVCCIHGPGNPELVHSNPKTHRDNIHGNPQADGATQTPDEVVMQNGKFSAESKWRTLGVPPPNCKPNHKSHLAALIWKLDCRLTQGMLGCNTGTNTIVFIKKKQVPNQTEQRT